MQTFSSHVAGIPCEIRVRRYHAVRGNYSSRAADPDEYYGWTECEFDVLDRRGRPAAWLEKKLTDDEQERIEREIAAYMKEGAEA